MATATSILHSHQSAEDALMEAFCRLWQKRGAIGTKQDAEALSKVTVRRVSIDMLRREKVRQTEDIADNMGAKATANAHDELERTERFAQVESIINSRLSPLSRQILEMKEYDGLSLKQIAQQLGKTEQAVAMQLSRARQTIRDEYRKQSRL